MPSGLWKLCSSRCLFTLIAAEPQTLLSDSQGLPSSRIPVSLQAQEWVPALHASPDFPLICLFLEFRLRPRVPSPLWTLILCYLQGLLSALGGGGNSGGRGGGRGGGRVFLRALCSTLFLPLRWSLQERTVVPVPFLFLHCWLQCSAQPSVNKY